MGASAPVYLKTCSLAELSAWNLPLELSIKKPNSTSLCLDHEIDLYLDHEIESNHVVYNTWSSLYGKQT